MYPTLSVFPINDWKTIKNLKGYRFYPVISVAVMLLNTRFSFSILYNVYLLVLIYQNTLVFVKISILLNFVAKFIFFFNMNHSLYWLLRYWLH